MTEQLTGQIVDQSENPVSAATVHVRDSDGVTVALTDSGGNVEANPTTTGTDGRYDVYVPEAGLYYLTVQKGGASLVIERQVTGVGERRWTEIESSKYTAAPSDTDTLLMSDTSDLKVGIPLRYAIGGTTYYGYIKSITSNTSIDVIGAPLSGSVTSLEYGRPEMLVQMPINVGGSYAGTAQDILENVCYTYVSWPGSTGYLCGIRAKHVTDDTGANNPKINAKVGGSLVSNADSNNGIQVSTTWADNDVAINTTNYSVEFEDALEIAVTSTGSNADAEDLSVELIFVEE